MSSKPGQTGDLRKWVPFLGARRGVKSSNGAYTVAYRKTSFTADGLEQTHFPPSNALDRPAAQMILQGAYFEPLTHFAVEWLLKRRPGDMISAGTYFGDMLPSWSQKCSGTVYAFEPVLESYLLARLCQEENQLKNVILFNAALSEKIGSVFIRSKRESDGKAAGGGARVAKRGDQMSATMSMDCLGLTDLSVIQLDLEGHEAVALKGAQETILRNRPVIMIEDTRQDCYQPLTDLGYRLVGEIPGSYIWTHPDDFDDLSAFVKAHADGYKRPKRVPVKYVRSCYPGSADEETERAKAAALASAQD